MVMLKKLLEDKFYVFESEINFYIIEPIYTLCNVLVKTVSIPLSISLSSSFPTDGAFDNVC